MCHPSRDRFVQEVILMDFTGCFVRGTFAAVGEKLEYYCGGDCMVDTTGHFCVLGTATKALLKATLSAFLVQKLNEFR